MLTFTGAPVSKGLLTGLGTITVLASASSRSYLFDVPLHPHIARDHQLWRLVVHHFAFANSSELFLAILLLSYTAMPVERAFGSVKFASFLVVVMGMSTVMETVALLMGQRIGFTKIPAGPFAIVFAILYQFSRLIPSSFYWKVFGVEVTDNIGHYFVASQLLSSQPPATILVSLIGVLSSYLYRSDFLSLRSYRLSPRLVLLFSRLFSPLLGLGGTGTIPRRPNNATVGYMEPPTLLGGAFAQAGFPTVTLGVNPRAATAGAGTTTATATVVNGGAAQRRTTGVAGSAATSPQAPQGQGFVQQFASSFTGSRGTPSAEQIADLTAMFPDRSREVIISALQSSRLDVSAAAEILLATPP
ncbi:hypothetical protein T439DRAFT_302814 [Meredithblackwellia eburnea MCA 4105]